MIGNLRLLERIAGDEWFGVPAMLDAMELWYSGRMAVGWRR
jgi:hypothetical protein